MRRRIHDPDDQPARSVPAPRTASPHGSAAALQRAVGNRAFTATVGAAHLLLRRTGWAATAGANKAPSTHGSVRRIPIEDPSLPGNKDPDLRAGVSAADRAVILVPSGIDTTKPVQALLHLHGLNEGLRGQPPRDLAASLDRMEEQLNVSIGRGDTQIVGVLAQGTSASSFGRLKDDPDAYVRACLAVLKSDAGIDITSLGGVAASGHSAGGNTIAEMAKRETSIAAPRLQSVLLFEGINNFRKTEDRPDPKDPAKTITVTLEAMAGRDKLDTYMAMVARRLRFDLDQLAGKTADQAATYLASSFVFRAYYGGGGYYDSVHRLLDQAIRTFFGETVSAAELAEQNRRLPGGGLKLSSIPEAANLARDFAALGGPAATALRDHYRVVRVEQLADNKKHAEALDDSKGAMHSLGHDNIVGSGAFLDALKATRGQR